MSPRLCTQLLVMHHTQQALNTWLRNHCEASRQTTKKQAANLPRLSMREKNGGPRAAPVTAWSDLMQPEGLTISPASNTAAGHGRAGSRAASRAARRGLQVPGQGAQWEVTGGHQPSSQSPSPAPCGSKWEKH